LEVFNQESMKTKRFIQVASVSFHQSTCKCDKAQQLSFLAAGILFKLDSNTN